MEVKGRVHEIGATQQVTESFSKRDLILAVSDNPEYVEYVRFEATQDKTSLFDGLAVGDTIEVGFNLRGRPWTNKEGVTTYFNSLVAWRVTKGESEGSYEAPVVSHDEDDLPF